MTILFRQKTTFYRLADTPATAKAWVVEDVEQELERGKESQEKVISSPEPAATSTEDKNDNLIQQLRKKRKLEKQQEVGFLILIVCAPFLSWKDLVLACLCLSDSTFSPGHCAGCHGDSPLHSGGVPQAALHRVRQPQVILAELSLA